jgi:hypothetical protein
VATESRTLDSEKPPEPSGITEEPAR